ncbi:MAG: AAA-like domain protein [Firmicutes bacterium ADurb.Bin419]|nr:MAG: AAA-like domain protein [Firmicutes bacterium ADurb.Bin419]
MIGALKEVRQNIKNAVSNENLSEKRELVEQGMLDADPELKDLYQMFRTVSNDIFRTYLPIISDKYYPVPLEGPYSHESQIKILKVDKWVTDENENSIDKLKNVYNTLMGTDCNLALIFRRSNEKCTVYLAVANNSDNDDPAIVHSYWERVKQSIKGNFPGTRLSPDQPGADLNIEEELSLLFAESDKTDNRTSLAIATNVATEKSDAFISQGIDKLLNGFVPQNKCEEYTLILLAEPLKSDYIEEIKQEIFDYYSFLSPFMTWQKNRSKSESVAKLAMVTAGGSFSKSFGGSAGVGRTGVQGNKSITVDSHVTSGDIENIIGQEGITLTYTAYDVKVLLERLENQMKRLEEGEALGMWNFAAYVLSNDFTTANNVASMYKSLTQGTESFIEKSTVNSWNAIDENAYKSIGAIKNALTRLSHPEFELIDKENAEYPSVVKATSYISGVEVARAMNFPEKSIPGIPVLQCAEFGRDVISYDYEYKGDLDIGCIYHMHQMENKRVSLDKNSLASHSFITGSTGSGKTNTIYKLIDKITDGKPVTFLVVEPAKGEYKNIFGNREDVFVYGTNPRKTEMLRINPFSFPADIHILEHLDRLVEIFNVCWPMYAAMPAIMKESIERAYVNAGWDLQTSVNKYDNRLFPSFSDILINIRQVVQESDYSSDNKGDYTGALITRVKSLTNGINGMIFVQDELSDEELFDRNVIIDLSRVGSTETKALIIGLVVMKLQEYRLSMGIPENSDLRHITVLEEAHNLLKRTPLDFGSDSANLLGKSVEMLANAIAEMRTYGEGFIIADQSPGLLDMSVIRNTNTKIILRLPDYSDRELVGKAAGLNDEQIIELSRLQRGVAAVYQNDWVNPVLCKIDHFEHTPIQYLRPNQYVFDNDSARQSLLNIILNRRLLNNVETIDSFEDEKELILKSTLLSSLKCRLMEYLQPDNPERLDTLGTFAYEFFNSREALKNARTADDIERWKQEMIANLDPPIKDYNERDIEAVIALIINEQMLCDARFNNLYLRYMEFLGAKRGLI